jgi:hypothetical protein
MATYGQRLRAKGQWDGEKWRREREEAELMDLQEAWNDACEDVRAEFMYWAHIWDKPAPPVDAPPAVDIPQADQADQATSPDADIDALIDRMAREAAAKAEAVIERLASELEQVTVEDRPQ